MIFYIAAAVAGAVTLTADMILRYMEKIRSFGFETRFHNIKGKTIPIEHFIPHNFTMAAVFCLALGITGIPLKLLGINGFVTFPMCLLSGAMVNFFIMHFIFPLISERPLPKKADLSECEAVCLERMDADGYGKVSVVWNGRKYEFPAVSANGHTIEKGESVVILYKEDGVCFAERPDRIIDVLNEKEQRP